MLIKNLLSLIIPPVILFFITKRSTPSSLFFLILLSLYSPDKTGKFYKPSVMYSPSSGKIMDISVNTKNKTVRIAIFLSLYNNHTQYVPIDDSVVVDIKRIHGKKIPAYMIESSHNEQLVTKLYNKYNNMYYKIYQMTGIIARRLKTMVKINHSYNAGDRLGFIFLGSRVDIVIPLYKIKKILIRNNQIINAMEPIILLN